MDPQVTVVIPTYNRPDQLMKAVASVKKQQNVICQIIIVDDASDNDQSADFQGDELVTYVRNDTNKGGGYSRNRGLSMATGKYVNFLDDDDEFLDDKLQKQIARFESSEVPNLGLVTCHVRDLRSGEEIIVKNTHRGNVFKESLSGYSVKLTPSMLFLTEAAKKTGGFDESLPASQEYDFVIRLSKHYGVDYVDEVLAQANRSETQISLDFDKKKRAAEILFRKFDKEYRNFGRMFWLKMQIKLRVLKIRFWAGRRLGFRAYKLLLFGRGI
jgi:glycosyltransferase involved in cell wall biosynthesis